MQASKAQKSVNCAPVDTNVQILSKPQFLANMDTIRRIVLESACYVQLENNASGTIFNRTIAVKLVIIL